MMKDQAIQATRAEILRLLGDQKSRLEGMLASELLRERTGVAAQRSLDRQSARRLLGILENESRKVERLEMVLAVVGTMKAGKSTVINAIIGSEVLPNRNQPMTTLPTLIRHVPGQTVPVLHFPKPQPFQAMAEAIRGKLRNLQAAGRLEDVALYGDPDGRPLVEGLLAGRLDAMSGSYSGPQQIFAFLKGVNDLARLARDPLIGMEPPLDAYDTIDDLPVIEVEFVHLRDMAAVQEGRVSLLDTPGHNEYGQSDRLLGVVRDQLAKASAVLAVLDYTQLKSEAEDQVRRELEAVAGQTEDRLYVLVNKFDQRDRNSMSSDQVGRHVAENLLRGRLDAARVFPVSARYAYLANLALATLQSEGRLPDHGANPWVEDFAHVAFGSDWEKLLGNPAKTAEAARKLWTRSQFGAPLREVVMRAARQAAVFSMRSALAKLSEHAKTIENFMKLRRGAIIARDPEEVRALVAGLEQDIRAVEAMKAEVGAMARGVVASFEGYVDRLAASTQGEMDKALAECLADARALEDQRRKAEGEGDAAEDGEAEATASGTLHTTVPGTRFGGRPGGVRPAAAFGRRGSAPGRVTAATAATIDETPVRLPSLDDAEAVTRRIAGRIQTVLDKAVDAARDQFAAIAGRAESEQAKAAQAKAAEVMAKVGGRLADKGFALDLDLPSPRLDGVVVQFGGALGNLLTRRTERRTGWREREGLSAGVGRFLWGGESDAGYEAYTYNEVVYEIDPARIRQRLAAELEAVVIEMRRQAHEFAKERLEPALVGYFSELELLLQGFRGDLLDGIEDRSLDSRALSALDQEIQRYAAAGQESAEGIAALRAEMNRSIEADLPPAVAAAAPAGGELVLGYLGRDIIFDGTSGPLSIGRSPDSGIVIDSKLASRNHASIVRRADGFAVVDHSTNGTVVEFEDGSRRTAANSAVELLGAGRLGVGADPSEGDAVTVTFRLRN